MLEIGDVIELHEPLPGIEAGVPVSVVYIELQRSPLGQLLIYTLRGPDGVEARMPGYIVEPVRGGN